MALKIIRAVWFLSVLAVLARLLFGYAGWQEELVIQETDNEQLVVGKEVLFYLIVAGLVTINVLVYIVGKVFAKNEALRTWIHGLVISINVFFIVGISLIGLYNTTEKFDYSDINFIIYGSVVLVVLVALVWPLYLIAQKFFPKATV